MLDIFSLIGAGSTLSLVGLCYKMASDKNGKFISKDVCDFKHEETKVRLDAARNILESKIISLKEDITEIKADVKFIRNNGKQS